MSTHNNLYLLFLIAIIQSAIQPATSFLQPSSSTTIITLQPSPSRWSSSSIIGTLSTSSTLLRADPAGDDDSSNDEPPPKKKKGDSLRDATGIRPSLHPVTINCVAEALLLRSQCVLGKNTNKDGEEIAIDTADSQTEPIQIAITAAGIAMTAIDQRAEASKKDETTDEFTVEESQVISGRVVGVIMRMRELEQVLVSRVNDVTWVRKYGEEESFGLLKKEAAALLLEEEKTVFDDSEALEKQLADTIKINPLFRMNRAECLLALFLSTVEKPKLDMVGEDVPGGSNVDFIDADRLDVLLQL